MMDTPSNTTNLKSEIRALQQIVHQNNGVIEPLKVLGLPSTASSETIRQVYKHKSLLLHPDRNDNHPGANEAFSYISNAYQLLTDPSKDTPSPKFPNIDRGYRQYDKLCEELLKRLSEEDDANNSRKRKTSDFSHLSTTQVIRSFIDQTALPKPPVHKRKRHKPKSLSFTAIRQTTEPQKFHSDILPTINLQQQQQQPQPQPQQPEDDQPSPDPIKNTPSSSVYVENQRIRVMRIPWLID